MKSLSRRATMYLPKQVKSWSFIPWNKSEYCYPHWMQVHPRRRLTTPPPPLRFHWQFTCTRLCSRGKGHHESKDSSQQHNRITQPGHTRASCLRNQRANCSATASLKVREQARCITLQDAGWLKPWIRRILTLHIQKSTSIDNDIQSILCTAPVSSRLSSPCCFKPQCAPVTKCLSIFDPCYVRKRMAICIAVECRCSFLKHCLISRFCHEKR